MSREPTVNPRYEPILNSDTRPPEEPCSSEDQDLPPHYHEVAEQLGQNVPSPVAGACVLPPGAWGPKPPGGTNSSVPPSYEAATTLPTYKDVELEKEHEARLQVVDEMFGLSSMGPEPTEPQIDGVAIGNDCLFFFAFLVAFFFNWIGLFIGYCIMYSFAGRYGAMAGFGVSMMKWLMYIKYSTCCNRYLVKEHDYVFWILNIVAFIILLKGLLGWITVRKYRNTPPDCPTDQIAPRYSLLH